MLAALVLFVSTVTVSLSTIDSALVSALDGSAGSGTELKRGAFFGAKVDSISDEVRERLKLESDSGAVIDRIIPGSTAEGAGFKSGDVILSIDGAKVEGANELVRAIAGRKANTSIAIAFRRGDALRTLNVTLKGRPLETSDDYETVYGAVPCRAGLFGTDRHAAQRGRQTSLRVLDPGSRHLLHRQPGWWARVVQDAD